MGLADVVLDDLPSLKSTIRVMSGLIFFSVAFLIAADGAFFVVYKVVTHTLMETIGHDE